LIFQGFDYFELISDIISVIVRFLQPVVTPIGEWMIIWINFALAFFPKENLIIYIIIFISLLILGVLINWFWLGDKIATN
jgi:ABC-type proline/glycine betaine transport system permease subunit